MIDSIASIAKALHTEKLLNTLPGIRRGIEKESLRITTNGHLSQSPHPKALGSALCHPAITTDYSEALLEFITPALDKPQAVLDTLTNIHHYVYKQMDEEILWVNSMPCITGGDKSIPIAQYGSSNSGRMKTIYRHGLWHRYGRVMQSISGIHYNFSLPNEFWEIYQSIKPQSKKGEKPSSTEKTDLQSFINTEYFNLIRNFQRFNWLPIYLFGASPAVCASFLKGREHSLVERANHTLYKPYATSLRMSDLGYQNDAQSDLKVCYNHLDSYVATLDHAIRTPHTAYETIGLKDENQYKQLNTNILQIENEYYGSIRPKQTTQRGERPTLALQRRGVEYIEMRCVDLNPYNPIGIDLTQMHFLDVFALYCLMAESRNFTDAEQTAVKENLNKVVMDGRNTQNTLSIYGETLTIQQWGLHLCEELSSIAKLLDHANNTNDYSKAVVEQEEKFKDPSLTPSAKILADIGQGDTTFYHFAMEQALKHRQHFEQTPVNEEAMNELKAMSEQSLKDQQRLESTEEMSFEEYLATYFSN